MTSELFDWVNDIEKIYQKLIADAKETNIEEMRKFEGDQDKAIQLLVQKRKNIIENFLQKLDSSIEDRKKEFRKEIEKIIGNYTTIFKENKESLAKNVIDELGLMMTDDRK